jgi:hypothetical protein
MRTRLPIALVLLMTAAVLLGSGCSSKDDGTKPAPVTPTGSVSGVVDGGAKSLAAATVRIGSLTTTTNEQGYFTIPDVPIGQPVVDVSQAGYMSVQRVVTVLSGQNVHLPDIFLPVAETAQIDGAAGGTATTSGGTGSVTFGAGSFVTAGGTPYTGQVQMEMAAVRPNDANFFQSFPGKFEGIREDGSTAEFVSYGFMGVKLYNSDKSAEVRLAPGKTAQIGLFAGATAKSLPASIPLWYFDETNGVWREQGAATLSSGTYVGEVTHFTTWNWDMPVSDICSITGIVHNDSGQPVANARVFSRGVGYAIMDEALTNAQGAFSVRAMRNAASDLWAMKGSFASSSVRVTVGNDCPYVLSDPLSLHEPAFSITLTWGAQPDDLDSHLYIPMTWNQNFTYYHLYYSNMGDLATDPFTQLDTDDTTSYGPEIISSAHFYQGTYQYWVHDYSGDSSNELRASGATVVLEINGQLTTFRASAAPMTGDDTGWWHVFDIVVNGTGRTVHPVMAFQPEITSGLYEGKKLPKK